MYHCSMIKQLTIVILTLSFLGCSYENKKSTSTTTSNSKSETISEEETQHGEELTGSETSISSWKGKLDGKTNIQISIQDLGNVWYGEIIYLDTKSKRPIELIGEVMEDNYFRLLEFNKEGYVSGILTGQLEGDKIINGSWFSPKSRKELKMELEPTKLLVNLNPIEADRKKIFGDYHYQFGPDGHTGTLSIKSLGGNRATFELNAVTGAPAYNIADISKDTITLKENSFVYPLKYTEGCEIEVHFYNNFAQVVFPNGYCDGGFGHNASPEGFYYKVK